MKIYVVLAERGAQNNQNATVSLLNVGWSVTQLRRPMSQVAEGQAPPLVTGPLVVVVFIEAELAMCNRPLGLEIELISEDGRQVEVSGPSGAQAVRLEQQIIVPSPPGVPTGFPGHASAMMDLPVGLPLAPGIYSWRVRVNGREEQDWSAHFYVAAPPQPPTFGYPVA
ncbi:MAG TPA: hypothetical protein VFN61_00800 [Acidimicrobiales bacterium]|nr:hypothetical protein [Acidimicrobiales bacterium]